MSKAKTPRHDNLRDAAVGECSRKDFSSGSEEFSKTGFSSPVVVCADSDGVTGIQSQGGPLPKRVKLTTPCPTQAPSDRIAVKRKLSLGAPTVTSRIVAHILAKKAKLAQKLSATTRPPE